MPYSFAAAKVAFTEAEKDRILALYLSSDISAINALVLVIFVATLR